MLQSSAVLLVIAMLMCWPGVARSAPVIGHSAFAGAAVPRPRGLASEEAYRYYREAMSSASKLKWLDCVDSAQASLLAEDNPVTRSLSASCEERTGLWVEALADYEAVTGSGNKAPPDTARQAEQRAQALREKIPRLILRRPLKAKELVVKLDGNAVPPRELGGEIWVNPGQHLVEARGRENGAEGEFEQVVTAGESGRVTIDIKLGFRAVRDAVVTRCTAQAQTREDLVKCLGSGSSGGGGPAPNFHIGAEISGYHDTDHVDVVAPSISLGVESPTDGWGVAGSFLVDVVTNASTDIVATASPRAGPERRYVPAIGGHKKLGDLDAALRANMSVEPDYFAAGGGTTVTLDLAQKTVTPSLSYDFGYDILGRSSTPFDVYSKVVTRHGVDLGLGLVLDSATFLALSGTGVLEFGDSSKPYRYVPMFPEELVREDRIASGTSIDDVNRQRLSARAIEQLPDQRQRWAVAGRIAHRFASSTLRAEERVYIDNWGLRATTTDLRYLLDLTPAIRIWPHFRFHAQTGVDFWRRAYIARWTDNSTLEVPALRTGDRELGPFLQWTLGGGTRVGFGPGDRWGLGVSADFVISRYLNHLFIEQKLGYLGAMILDMEFE